MTRSVSILERIAGAPISWGVCEVPGWGFQLDPERVLSEMHGLGLVATEFGPDGFLPAEPESKARVLTGHGLHAVGGFIPVVLHDEKWDPLPGIERELDSFVAAGATRLVLSADTGNVDYDTRAELSEDQWSLLFSNLDRIAFHAKSRGIIASIHPHVGTVVALLADVRRVLAGSSIGVCLDTGHLLIGGTDPVWLATEHSSRVAHVHLKDVRADVVQRVQTGELSYTDAVAQGMYVPLGQGDADIAGVVTVLEGAGYSGYYVLEQDTILAAESKREAGPVDDVRRSLEFIKSVTSR